MKDKYAVLVRYSEQENQWIINHSSGKHFSPKDVQEELYKDINKPILQFQETPYGPGYKTYIMEYTIEYLYDLSIKDWIRKSKLKEVDKTEYSTEEIPYIKTSVELLPENYKWII